MKMEISMNSNRKKRKILYIPAFDCSDYSNHAGGHTCNFYLTSLFNDERFDLRYSTFDSWEVHACENMKVQYGIEQNIEIKLGFLQRYFYNILTFLLKKIYIFLSSFFKFQLISISFLSEYPFKLYIKKVIKHMLHEGLPDLVILDWTQTNIWAFLIKRKFPNLKIVSIEQDVSFLRVSRSYPKKTNLIDAVKKREINSLKLSDLTVLFNKKDCLLVAPYIEKDKILIVPPFFHRYGRQNRSFDNVDGILFFGAMNRYENIEAVKYFLNEIFVSLKHKMKIKFYCVGAGISEEVKDKYESYNVIFTGFVRDPSVYFEKSFCMVAPLFHGAGIKVKVLEGLAAGLPIVTNDLGIEGIPAIDKYHFILCKKKEDYIEEIDNLFENRGKCSYYSKNALDFIESNYNLNKSANEFKASILKLTDDMH